MSGSGYDPTEFIDRDFQGRPTSYAASGPGPQRAPTREEVESRVTEAQQKLAELKRAQEELERQRSGLEETRRRQSEFATGRQEMIQHLTRGIGLLEEAELEARREAEQYSKTVAAFREALDKVTAIQEQTWTGSNFEMELTRALTAIENARMEWNSARVRFPQLDGELQSAGQGMGGLPGASPLPIAGMKFGELCRMGLALTWPLAVVALLVLAVVLVLLLRP